jgi:4-amino-4-deoxy-L-arabinose transferase-like glycosyltransferase
MATSHLSDTLRLRIAYDGTRTPVKTGLFLIVCLAWLIPGLVGHDPWKGDEAVAFGIVSEMLRLGDWSAIQVAGEPYPGKAPLYFWLATLLAKGLGAVMPLHDAARLASGVFMASTLALLSLTALELMGERAMRVSVLLLIGCLGLLIRAHEMNSDLAGLTGVALGLYGLALAPRRARLGGALAGLGMGVAFLGDGFLPLALLLALAAVLPLAAPAYRTRSYALALAIALACAAPLVALWLALLGNNPRADLALWLQKATASRWTGAEASRTGLFDIVYFVKVLPWYAWPAWPLAAWSLWKGRKALATRKDLQMPFAALATFLVVLSFFAEAREVNALPLLLPLSLLGVAEIDSLKRGAASALDWFGLTTFFLLAALIWVAWFAALTGSPEGLAAVLQREVPGFKYRFSFLPFALAALLTLVWLVVVARSLRTTRRALVNWTAGITMVWMLVMTLCVPLIDQARSYRGMALALAQALPVGYICAVGVNVGDAQRALLNRFAGLYFQRPDGPYASRCGLRVVQASPSNVPVAEAGWVEVWRGARPGDKTELFVVYKRG